MTTTAQPIEPTSRHPGALDDRSASPLRTMAGMILLPLVTTKLISLGVPTLVWTLHGIRGGAHPARLLDTFTYWDAEHYLYIAQRGYPPRVDFHDAFLPGYPLLVRAAHTVVLDYVIGGLLVNVACEAIAFYFLARLVIGERSEDAARYSLWLFALWPFAFFLSAIYTESAFIAGAAAALFYARRGSIAKASVAASIAAAVRLPGLLLFLPLLMELVKRRPIRLSQLSSLLLIPVPLVLYATYLHFQTGEALAFLRVQDYWGHRFAWPWQGFLGTLSGIGRNRGLETAFAFGGLFACAGAWVKHRLPDSLAVYCSLVWLSATSLSFWQSVPRYELALFPLLVMAWDAVKGRPLVRAGLLVACASALGFTAAAYASGNWLA